MGQPPLSPQGGMFQGINQGIGQPGAPPPPQTGLNSWQRWQQVHPGTPYSDYRNWWNQFGAQGATINGEVSFGGEGSLGDEDLCGGFSMQG